MYETSLSPVGALAPIIFAFVLNMFAEWLLMASDRRFATAFAKSLKAIIVPALIALYALIIAGAIVGQNDG